MAALSGRKQPAYGLVLGRGSGLLLALLGVIILCLLFWATGGHRARLAAEGLGVVVAGGLTLVVVGITRPSAQVVTRAYVSLSGHTRALLIVGIIMVFGFAVVTAAIEPAIPRLREIPAFGGLVTLDWVLSLTVLAVAGATLLLLGLVAIGASPEDPSPTAGPGADFILERLSYASNSGNLDLLHACFVRHEAGEEAFRAWHAMLSAARPEQVLLVNSCSVGDRLWSEWHVRADRGHSLQRWILVVREAKGLIADVALFHHVLAPIAEPANTST